MKTITVIDTFAFFFRSYFALPPLKNSEGFPTGLLTGFVNFIHQLQKEHATDYIVFALDSEGPTFRKELYPEYKANRPAPPEDLIRQLPVAIRWVEKMGFANLSKERFEADDVIATLTRCGKEQGIVAKIVSSDKDLYQLLDDDRVYLYDWVKKNVVDEEGCRQKFGVSPRYFVDFQALIGDSSDNVPGVPGIGPKTASKLINEYHTLENLYAHIDEAGTPRIRKLLIEHEEQAFLSRELVRLVDDVFDSCALEEYAFEERNYLAELTEEFEKYEMRQALRWAKEGTPARGTTAPGSAERTTEASAESAPPAFEAVLLDTPQKLEEVLGRIPAEAIVAFDTETTGLDTRTAKLVGFSFAFEEERAYYVPVGHSYLGVGPQVDAQTAEAALRRLTGHRIVGQNLKFDLSLLYHRLGLEPIVPEADTMILAWLLDPGSRVGLDTLMQKLLGYRMKSFKETVKKGQDFSGVALEEAAFYAAEDAWATRALYFRLRELFEKGGLESLLKEAKEVEFPFIDVLIRMESLGIRVDTERLLSLKEELSAELQRLTAEIHELAGTEFNIKSTQQLGGVLFGTLGLPGGKKTKTGYSTNEAVLRKLLDAHPIVAKILEFREDQKMLSTYVEPLRKLAQTDPQRRIHTTFIQTGTATGRLASKDPNLQNIPVRSELGRRVRGAFVAEEGYRLVSIDYSQIELRLLAHFSGDAALREAFAEDQDIHMATAIKLFGPEEAAAKRNFAKSINFGLLYGMGSRKLADELKITTREAKEIIEAYFAAFPTVRSYLQRIQEQAKERGYVETLLGRRRNFDYEGAGGMQKAAILREAVNTVFQGSAADLIKLAMLEIDTRIRDEELPARMLLQIHDELIFEIRQEKTEEIAAKFRSMMERIYPLEVALKCSVSIGERWSELK
ncbi:DNA polymerase I [Nitratifractor sp.]|uniref:DNA polymerase I n=2 Tax=Nitratifractor sp. TaxID=2268144 RepID=UPI0025E9CADE|nr:DNA polymerase I [Nitratifractor sp.]